MVKDFKKGEKVINQFGDRGIIESVSPSSRPEHLIDGKPTKSSELVMVAWENQDPEGWESTKGIQRPLYKMKSKKYWK